MLKEKLLTVGGLFYYGSATPDVGVYSTPIWTDLIGAGDTKNVSVVIRSCLEVKG